MTATDFLDLAVARLHQPGFLALGAALVFLIAVSKGAFGGGLAILGIPVLSLVMEPVAAAIVIAPLVSLMDMVTLRSFGRSTWSRADLAWLLPGLMAGIAVGWLVFEMVDERRVSLLIALITLGFTVHWFVRGRHAAAVVAPPRPVLALATGAVSGFTTFVAHAGGPPVAMYLLRRGLSKASYAGTTTAFFTLGNLIKLAPYLALGLRQPQALADALVLAPVVPLGVLAGVALHRRMEQAQLFFWCYLLLLAAASKMLLDAVVH